MTTSDPYSALAPGNETPPPQPEPGTVPLSPENPAQRPPPRRRVRYAVAAAVVIAAVFAGGIGTGYAISGASGLRSQRNAAQASVNSYQTELGSITDQLHAANAQVDTDNSAIARDMRGWNACKTFGTAEQNVANTSQTLFQVLDRLGSTTPGSAEETSLTNQAEQLYNQMEQQIGTAAGQGSACTG